MSLAPACGRLREGTPGVDRSQAGYFFGAFEPVEEIGQTLWLDIIIIRLATWDRSVVTAAEWVYSSW